MVDSKILGQIGLDKETKQIINRLLTSSAIRQFDTCIIAEVNGKKIKLVTFKKIGLTIVLPVELEILELFDFYSRVEMFRIEILNNEARRNLVEIPIKEFSKLYNYIPKNDFKKFDIDLFILCKIETGKMKECSSQFKTFVKYCSAQVPKYVREVYYTVQKDLELLNKYSFLVRLLFVLDDLIIVTTSREYFDKPLKEFVDCDTKPLLDVFLSNR